MNLNFNFTGKTKLKVWWKIIKDNLTTIQTLFNTHQTAAVLDHPDKSVTTSKIADEAIGTAQMADKSVTTAKIADESVGTAQMADGSVTEDKLGSVLKKDIKKTSEDLSSLSEFIGKDDLAPAVYIYSTIRGTKNNSEDVILINGAINVYTVAENGDNDLDMGWSGTEYVEVNTDTYLEDTYLYLYFIIDKNGYSFRLFNAIKDETVNFSDRDAVIYLARIEVLTRSAGNYIDISDIEPFKRTMEKTNVSPIDGLTVCGTVKQNSENIASHKSADVLDHPDKSVTTEKIADKAVSTEQIADYAVESAKIASDAVLTEHIKDKNITKAKLSADITAILDKVKDATPSTGGLISSSDKAKLDGIAEGATKTVVDDALNGTSTNPLQNKVIATELKKKASVYNVSDFIGPDTYYRLPFNVGEYFILKNDGTEDVSKLLYGYNESWYSPSVYYWFSNTIKAGNTALCYMEQTVVDAGDIDGHDGGVAVYELNESFAQILQNQSNITALQQQIEEHITQTPDIAGGVHGVRAVDGKIEIFDGRNFVEMQKAYKTYGVSIDLTNSDPEAAVTYTDDAVGMVAGSSDWDNTNIFRDIEPCLFKDGAVVGYLNTDDFSKFADGTDADITSGDAGDVMIEIPKLGVKIATSGDTLTVQVTDDPNAEGFQYYAHTRQTMGDRDKLYIGAFLGYNLSSALRSLSGKMPTVNKTIGEFRALAQVNGEGYDQIAFYQLTLLQCLFLIKYKNRDSQTALGKGYTATSNTSVIQTGGTVAKGMDFGETTGTQQMKFMGIEDFWGNMFCFVDGLVSTSDYHALIATDNFNDDGTGYTDKGQMSSSYISGWMKATQGTSETGFIGKMSGGSATTYFADYAVFDAGYASHFGGHYCVDSFSSVFCLLVNMKVSNCDDSNGARLMYL